MLPASGTIIVKKSNGDDWFEEALDPADIGAAVDSEVVKLSGNQTVSGTKTFTSSPVGPTPTLSGHLTQKYYVDLQDTTVSGLVDINTGDISQLQSDLTTASGALQSQISSNDSDISNIQSDLITASGSLQSQISGNDSDISQLQSDLTTASGYFEVEIAELRQAVQVPVTSGTNLLVTNNQLPLDTGSSIQIGSNYTVNSNNITIAAVGSYRVSWLVAAEQSGSTANNRSRNPEITVNRNSGTFLNNTRTSTATDFSQGRSSGSMSGSCIIQTSSSNETVAIRSVDLSTNSTVSVVCVVKNGFLKIERMN